MSEDMEKLITIFFEREINRLVVKAKGVGINPKQFVWGMLTYAVIIERDTQGLKYFNAIQNIIEMIEEMQERMNTCKHFIGK